MVYFSVIFFMQYPAVYGIAEDRFQIFATLLVSLLTYILSFAVRHCWGIYRRSRDWSLYPYLQTGCFCLAHLFFLYTRNWMQKLILCLCVSNYAYGKLFTELVLGLMPFQTAGVGVCRYFFGCSQPFVYAAFGLCLYRYYRFYSDRSASGFIWV